MFQDHFEGSSSQKSLCRDAISWHDPALQVEFHRCIVLADDHPLLGSPQDLGWFGAGRSANKNRGAGC